MIPVLRLYLDSLVAALVKVNLVHRPIRLRVEHTADKAVRMRVLVVILTRLGVVRPGLRDVQRNIALGIMHRLEVLQHRVFDEVTNVCHLFVLQDLAVGARRIALIGITLLAEQEVQLGLGQITPEAEEPNWQRE